MAGEQGGRFNKIPPGNGDSDETNSVLHVVECCWAIL